RGTEGEASERRSPQRARTTLVSPAVDARRPAPLPSGSMAPVAEDLLFRRIALHYKLVTREQLLEAAQMQTRDGDTRRLGEILLAQGLLTPRQIEQGMALQRDCAATQSPAAPAPKTTGPLTLQAMPALTVQAMPEIAVAPPPAAAEPAPPPAFDLDAPRALDRLLERALRVGASDLHVHSGSPLKIRVHGQMYDIEGGTLAARTAERLILELLTPEQVQALRDSGQVDFAYTLAGKGRFRSNAYPQQRGIDAVLRVIPPPTPHPTA